MSKLLSDDDFAELLAAEHHAFRSPIPTQCVASDEYMPAPQSGSQRAVERRIRTMADDLAPQHGLSRRRFLASGAGMAAAFLAMNAVYGPYFGVSDAEAASPEAAAERARVLAGQFIFDDHTHFLRADAGPDSPLRRFVNIRESFARSGKNPDLKEGVQTYDDLLYENYVKELFFDSDTKIAMLSGAPAENPDHWFLTNAMKEEARRRVNDLAGSNRLMYQAVFMPGTPGWLDELDRTIEELKPDSWKGYTIGDNIDKANSHYPWRLDDETVTYPGYEKMLKAGIRNVCIHKGLFPPSAAERWPHIAGHADVSDVAKAAKDWPELNFIIYHSGLRNIGGAIDLAVQQFEETGRMDWVTDLAEIPEKHGVTNVYGDLGQVFANAAISHPRLAAGMLGTLVRGLGADHVVWGTDALWQGSPQWQIEAFRRLEIPEAMQRSHGYPALGPADGETKQAILGLNSARLYGLNVAALSAAHADDAFTAFKAEYDQAGGERSNMAYGFIRKGD